MSFIIKLKFKVFSSLLLTEIVYIPLIKVIPERAILKTIMLRKRDEIIALLFEPLSDTARHPKTVTPKGVNMQIALKPFRHLGIPAKTYQSPVEGVRILLGFSIII